MFRSLCRSIAQYVEIWKKCTIVTKMLKYIAKIRKNNYNYAVREKEKFE